MKKYNVKGIVVDSDNTVSTYRRDIESELTIGNVVLGGPKIDDEYNFLKPTWTLLRSQIRKQKIKRIYGTQNTDREEKF